MVRQECSRWPLLVRLQRRATHCSSNGGTGLEGEEAATREFLQRLAKRIGVEKTEDWAGVTTRHAAAEAGHQRALAPYGGSLYAALAHVYGNDAALRRRKKPQGYWQVRENRMRFLEELGRELGVQEPHGWAAVSKRQLLQHGARGLLAHYSNSRTRALEDLLGCAAPLGQAQARDTWAAHANRLRFVREVAARLSLAQAEDWRDVTEEQLMQEGAGGLLRFYGGSVHAMLRDTVGPTWEVYECRRVVPDAFWEDKAAVKRFLTYLRRRLQLRDPQEWLRVSNDQVIAHSGRGLLRQGPLLHAVLATWPHLELESGAKNLKKTQRLLRLQLSRLF